MTLTVNGQTADHAATTLADLVEELGLGDAKVATALNGAFVSVRARPATKLSAGDRVYDAVLLNTAVAKAGDPVRMAEAFARAIEAGRLGFEADPMDMRDMAAPSTPVLGKALLA